MQRNAIYWWALWFSIGVLALGLRLLPGWDALLWNTNDQARDSYAIRNIIAHKDLIILGPRSEVYSSRTQSYQIFTGPLYYYFLAPAYYFSQGDPNLPMTMMIGLNLFTMAIMGVLSWRLFRNHLITTLALILFATSPEQIGYARWLLNPIAALPFIALFYLALFQVSFKKSGKFWPLILGLSLGLAIENEMFLLYLGVISLGGLLLSRPKLIVYFYWLIGLVLGLLPLIVAELKFNFRMSKSLIFDLLLSSSPDHLSLGSKLSRYVYYLGLVGKHNLIGINYQWGLLAIGLVLVVLLLNYRQIKTLNYQPQIKFLWLWFFSHLLIFSFSFQNAIYINLGIGLSLILLVSLALYLLSLSWRSGAIILAFGLVMAQLLNLHSNLISQKPFGGDLFLKSDVLLFSQKMAIVDQIYHLSPDIKEVTVFALDTPYGVRTMWASVFEQYAHRHGSSLPKWYGFYANGFGGDQILLPSDFPGKIHVVIIPEPNPIDLATQNNYLAQLDQTTQIIDEKVLFGTRLQIRKSLITNP